MSLVCEPKAQTAHTESELVTWMFYEQNTGKKPDPQDPKPDVILLVTSIQMF